MSGDENAEASRWLQFAEDDLGAAETIHSAGHLPHRLVCFHCQQAVEKSLKSLLIKRGIDFPKTHDLNLLKRLIPQELSLKAALPDLSELTVFAAEARYPGDFPDASDTDAKSALSLAKTVIQISQDHLAE